MDVKLILAPVFSILTKNVGEYANFPNISLASLKAFINDRYQSQIIDLNTRLLKDNYNLFHQLYLFDEVRYRPLQYLSLAQIEQLKAFNFSDLPDLSLLLNLTVNAAKQQKIDQQDYLGLTDLAAANLITEIDRETDKDLAALQDQTGQVFAFSIFQSNIYYAAALAYKLKQVNKHNVIIWGGPSCAYLPLIKLLLKLGICDYIIMGEGEKSFLKLIDHLHGKENLNNIKNIAYYSNNEVKLNQEFDCIADVNELPLPDYSDYDLKFLQQSGIPLAFSRGCPFRCSFCSATKFWHNFRQMSVARSIEIIKHYYSQNGISKFYFFNPTINANEQWLNDFCLAIIKEQLPITWSGAFRAQNLSPETISNLQQAGCNYVDLAIENIDQEILNKMHKGIEISQAMPIIKNLLQTKIKLRLHLIVGFPGEKWRNFMNNFNFLVKFLQKIPQELFYNFYVSELFIDTNSEIFLKAQDFGIKIIKPVPVGDFGLGDEAADLLIKWYIDDQYKNETLKKINLMNRVKNSQ